MARRPPRRTEHARSFERALRFVEAEQLSNGEIPNYRRIEGDKWEYCFSPLASAVTHDVLGMLDPLSATFDAQALEQAGEERRMIFGRIVARLRRRIRRFLAWQQRSDGTWRFFGHGSDLPSDLETTACSAAALLDGGRAGGGVRPIALRGFVHDDGLFRSPGSRGNETDPDPWMERAANVQLMRCLAAQGEPDPAAAEALATDCRAAGDGGASSLSLLYAVGRLCQKSRVGALEQVAMRSIEAWLADTRDGATRFTTPLSCGLWLNIAIDFRQRAAVAPAARAVAAWLETPHRRRMDGLCDSRCAAPGLTTAVGLVGLARASAFEELS